MTKAEKSFKILTAKAKEVKEDREHTRLYISSTVSSYIRKQIAEMIRKEVGQLIIDKELGVITEEELEEEGSILRLVYKSL